MLDGLEKEGYLKRLPFNSRNVENSMSLAHRDVETARKMMSDAEYDWAFTEKFNIDQIINNTLSYISKKDIRGNYNG